MSKSKIKRRASKSSEIKKVVLKGPVLTNSGYGVHCRQVFKALLKRPDIDLYVTPTNWGKTSWILDSKFDSGIVDKILAYSKKKNTESYYDESYQVLIPDEWEKIAKNNIGITAGFEADIVKKNWIDRVNLMDSVIVPSEFTKAAFLKTSKESGTKLKTKIKVINEWYYDQFDDLKVSSLSVLEELKYDENILLMSQLTSNSPISDRKNTIKTIKTAVDFVSDKDIGIVLKINAGNYTETEKKKLLLLLESQIKDKNRHKVNLLFGSMSIKELHSLYTSKKISCFLSGSRAEGWGLPFIESASCGLPIIATNYSSYKEFLEDDFIQVDYDLVTFNHDVRFVDLEKNPQWAEFNSLSMFNCLTEFFQNKNKWISKAKTRQKIIKQKYNSSAIINNYIEFFENIS